MTADEKPDPKTCGHEKFSAIVNILRVVDRAQMLFSLELTVRCQQCDEPFRFLGIPAVSQWDRPTVSTDGQELRVPMETEREHQLLMSASFQMPTVSGKH